MSEHHDAPSTGGARERELEIEIARLQAEIDTLKGEDPSVATSRFLAMAAATVDQVVEDARREADEIAEEISAQAETRRDEATRVASEAEAMAETLLAEADKAQEAIDDARDEADSIKSAAHEEAGQIVATEREKIAVEAEALSEVRSALEAERGSLETYHDAMRQRVQELAESMVSFMTTELPAGAASAIENLNFAQLDSVVADKPDLDPSVDDALAEDEVEESDRVTVDPWVRVSDTAATDDESEESDFFEMPDSAVGEIPDGPPMTFDGHDIQESEDEDDMKPTSSGLFSRSRMDDPADVTDVFEDLASDFDRPSDATKESLFGTFGPRLIEQTGSDELAVALEDADDDAFRQFIAGDDEPDPSRDWLLRPEKG